MISIYFFKYETIETHARVFLALIISVLGSVWTIAVQCTVGKTLGTFRKKRNKKGLKEVSFSPILFFNVPIFLQVSFIGQLLHCVTSSGTSYILDFLFGYVKRVVNFYSIEKAKKFIKSHFSLPCISIVCVYFSQTKIVKTNVLHFMTYGLQVA